MTKSKEFSKPQAAMQTEETLLIVSQIPKEHMGAAIRELVEIGKARPAKKEAANRGQMHPDNVKFFRNLMSQAKAKGPVPPKDK
jgi:hypothetical protein